MKTLDFKLLIYCVMLAFGSVQARTIRIPAEYSKIQDGVNASVNGDTVLVSDGTYSSIGDKNEPVIDFMGKQIVVKSENGPLNCTLSHGCYVVNFANGETNKSVLDGFTITGADPGSGISCYNSSPTIINNIITKNWSEYNLGAVHLFNSSAILMNNLFYQNEVFGDCAGIMCYSNSKPKIINNTFIGNITELLTGGIITEPASGNSKLSTVLCDSSSKATITNCIFIGTEDFKFTNCLITYSCLDKYVSGVGNIQINPTVLSLLILGNSDNVTALSSAFSVYVADKGTLNLSGISLPEYDLLGNIRVLNKKVDIGAIEASYFTSIDNNIMEDGPVLYPNPISDNFSLSFKSTVNNVKLEIYSLEGKLLFSRELDKGNNFSINVKGIRSGLYIAKITDLNRVYSSSIVIK